jgi:hypothetical protein
VTTSAPVGGGVQYTMILRTPPPAGPPGTAVAEAGATAFGGRDVTVTRAGRVISWYTPPWEENASVVVPGEAQVMERVETRVPHSS